MNAWYGIYGFNYIQHLGIEAEQGHIEPFKLFTVLQPQNYKGMGFAAINRFFISPSPVVLVLELFLCTSYRHS